MFEFVLCLDLILSDPREMRAGRDVDVEEEESDGVVGMRNNGGALAPELNDGPVLHRNKKRQRRDPKDYFAVGERMSVQEQKRG